MPMKMFLINIHLPEGLYQGASHSLVVSTLAHQSEGSEFESPHVSYAWACYYITLRLEKRKNQSVT